MASRPGWLLFESPPMVGVHGDLLVHGVGILEAGPCALRALAGSLYLSWHPLSVAPERSHQGGSGQYRHLRNLFNALNGLYQWLCRRARRSFDGFGLFSDPRFALGCSSRPPVGSSNYQADMILIICASDGFYRLPHTARRRLSLVSGANYFGEILLWTGWAIMSWTPAGLVFALFTISNLLPQGAVPSQMVSGEIPRLSSPAQGRDSWLL